MKLATWNVNSLKVRLAYTLDWLAINQPDVLCLQETKQEDSKFPLVEFQQAGYQAAKILSGTPIKDIPVEFAQNLQLSINEKAAAAQGVTIPQDLIDKAVNKY